jgi:hypothetical protein
MTLYIIYGFMLPWSLLMSISPGVKISLVSIWRDIYMKSYFVRLDCFAKNKVYILAD